MAILNDSLLHPRLGPDISRASGQVEIAAHRQHDHEESIRSSLTSSSARRQASSGPSGRTTASASTSWPRARSGWPTPGTRSWKTSRSRTSSASTPSPRKASPPGTTAWRSRRTPRTCRPPSTTSTSASKAGGAAGGAAGLLLADDDRAKLPGEHQQDRPDGQFTDYEWWYKGGSSPRAKEGWPIPVATPARTTPAGAT